MTRKSKALLIPLLAIFFGFAISSLVIIITGKNPLSMFGAMLQALTGIIVSTGSFNPRYIGEFVVQSLPIILTGLSIAFAFRTGLFNIGAEGQLIIGATAATFVALYIKAPPGIHAVLCILAAMGGGALWGAIPGFMKARFNVHEVVLTIMMNYIALYLSNYMILGVFGSADRIKTAIFPDSALLKDANLAALTNGSRLHWGILVVLVAVIAFWFIIEKTTFGYSLRAVGFNKEAARSMGMKIERNIVMSMTISGVFSGMAGAIITIGTFSYGRVLSAMEGYGFDGIAVALVGNTAALGTFLAGLLFGMLKAAQPLMQSQGIPREIASIIQALIVIFVAMKYGLELIVNRTLPQKKIAISKDKKQ